MNKYSIGVSSNCECGETIEEILINIKNAGFDSVMISEKMGNFEKSIQFALDIGLKIPYVHLAHDFSNSLWAIGNTNEKYVNSVIKTLIICSKYNIPIAVMHGTTGDASSLALPPNKQGLDSMKKILNVCENYNIKIALENLDANSIANFFYLLDNIDSPHLGFCYDIGHHQLYCPQEDLLKKYGNRLIAIHIHDNLMDWKYGMDWTQDLHLLPFDGKIEFEEILENISKTSYDNTILLELHKKSSSEIIEYDHLSHSKYLELACDRANIIAEKIYKLK